MAHQRRRAVERDQTGSDRRVPQLLAGGGMLGIVLFWVVAVFSGALRPGSHHFTSPIEDIRLWSALLITNLPKLGIVGAPYPFVTRGSVVVFGLVVIGLAIAVHHGLDQRGESLVGVGLIALGGVNILSGGVIPWDATNPLSLASHLHTYLSLVGIGAAIGAPLVIADRLDGDAHNRSIRAVSRATSCVLLGLFMLPYLGLQGGSSLHYLLIPRWVVPVVYAFYAVWSLWLVSLAAYLFTTETRPSPQSREAA